MQYRPEGPIWSRRERFSGEAAELIERLATECAAEQGGAGKSPGLKILIAAMCWLTIPLERRGEYWDGKRRLANVPPIPSSVPEEGFSTCWHCGTTREQTGKKWDTCDYCHVMLSIGEQTKARWRERAKL